MHITLHQGVVQEELPAVIMSVAKTDAITQDGIVNLRAIDSDSATPDERFIGAAECSHVGDRRYYFNRLFVLPEYRGRGYAGRLLESLLEVFRIRNLELILEINPYGDLNYEQLEAFYLNHGFKKHIIDDGDPLSQVVYLFNENPDGSCIASLRGL